MDYRDINTEADLRQLQQELNDKLDRFQSQNDQLRKITERTQARLDHMRMKRLQMESGLTREDQILIAEALINPPAPNEALQRAKRLHRENVDLQG